MAPISLLLGYILQEVLESVSTLSAMEEGRNWQSTFRERFCEYYKCDPADFEERVFWKAMHRHAYLIARWYFGKERSMFKEDLEFIHEIGSVRDPLIFKSELNRYHGRNVREKGWLRGTFAVRVSGKRIIRLKNRIFGFSS